MPSDENLIYHGNKAYHIKWTASYEVISASSLDMTLSTIKKEIEKIGKLLSIQKLEIEEIYIPETGNVFQGIPYINPEEKK